MKYWKTKNQRIIISEEARLFEEIEKSSLIVIKEENIDKEEKAMSKRIAKFNLDVDPCNSYYRKIYNDLIEQDLAKEKPSH